VVRARQQSEPKHQAANLTPSVLMCRRRFRPEPNVASVTGSNVCTHTFAHDMIQRHRVIVHRVGSSS
jgi:hypothetical protein